MVEKAARTRRWMVKTRTGCRTCRSRRVKCDERRPHCVKCTSTRLGLICEGYDVPAKDLQPNAQPLRPRDIAGVRSVPKNVSTSFLPAELSSPEVRVFDYFRGHAASGLAGHFSSSVFEKLILQLSHAYPVIFNVVVAVGSIYEARWMSVRCTFTTIRYCPRYKQALRYYNTAIGDLSRYIQSSKDGYTSEKVTIVLVACLLFVSFEILHGDQSKVLTHLVTGLKIIFEQSKRKLAVNATKRIVHIEGDTPDEIDQVTQVFTRLDLDSTMFGRRAPYLCPRSFGLFPGADLGVTSMFSSIEEARAHLTTLSSIAFGFRGELLKQAEQTLPPVDERRGVDWPRHYCVLHATVRTMPISPDVAFNKQKVLTAFDQWTASLRSLEQTDRVQAVLMLRIQSFYAWFIMATVHDKRASDCDRFQYVFEQTVELVSQYVEVSRSSTGDISFALESGITASLYLLGIKCRDPVIRRQAIRLLREHTVQEGMWRGQVYAEFCQRFMDLEEGRTRELPGSTGEVSFIPEQARFIDIVFGVDPSNPGIGRLICARLPEEEGSELEIVESRFKIDSAEGAQSDLFIQPLDRTCN